MDDYSKRFLDRLKYVVASSSFLTPHVSQTHNLSRVSKTAPQSHTWPKDWDTTGQSPLESWPVMRLKAARVASIITNYFGSFEPKLVSESTSSEISQLKVYGDVLKHLDLFIRTCGQLDTTIATSLQRLKEAECVRHGLSISRGGLPPISRMELSSSSCAPNDLHNRAILRLACVDIASRLEHSRLVLLQFTSQLEPTSGTSLVEQGSLDPWVADESLLVPPGSPTEDPTDTKSVPPFSLQGIQNAFDDLHTRRRAFLWSVIALAKSTQVDVLSHELQSLCIFTTDTLASISSQIENNFLVPPSRDTPPQALEEDNEVAPRDSSEGRASPSSDPPFSAPLLGTKTNSAHPADALTPIQNQDASFSNWVSSNMSNMSNTSFGTSVSRMSTPVAKGSSQDHRRPLRHKGTSSLSYSQGNRRTTLRTANRQMSPLLLSPKARHAVDEDICEKRDTQQDSRLDTASLLSALEITYQSSEEAPMSYDALLTSLATGVRALNAKHFVIQNDALQAAEKSAAEKSSKALQFPPSQAKTIALHQELAASLNALTKANNDAIRILRSSKEPSPGLDTDVELSSSALSGLTSSNHSLASVPVSPSRGLGISLHDAPIQPKASQKGASSMPDAFDMVDVMSELKASFRAGPVESELEDM